MVKPELGFIGCGRHAAMCIYPSLEALGIKLSAVCALHKDHADAVARKYDIPHSYDTYREMLGKEKPDAVFVAAGENAHIKIVADMLSAGVHVFVEKPLGLTVADAKRIALLSQKTGKHIQVGFMKRFSPIYQKAKRLMGDKTRFGSPVCLHGIFTCRNFGFGTDDRKFLLNAAVADH
ncbi:Gfo/Idh/MocA family oxidoreductase [Patescibacteria group bacterium]|nr:Gfo/Idh/MocA family oxidoreductase [Patescibacteria group bacterium]